MNDRQDPYGQQYHGYDEHGRPLPFEPQQHGYEAHGEYAPYPGQTGEQQQAYGQQTSQPGYGHHPYGAPDSYGGATSYGESTSYSGPSSYGGTEPYGGRDPYPGSASDAYHGPDSYTERDPYGAQDPYGGPDQYGRQADHAQQPGRTGVPQQWPYAPYGSQPGNAEGTGPAPQEAAVRSTPPFTDLGGGAAPDSDGGGGTDGRGGTGGAGSTGGASGAGGASSPAGVGGDASDYRTDQFAFVEEPSDGSEDVIDWLKFSESRTERRDERKRRGRNRLIALAIVLVLALAGGVGYLWYSGTLPGLAGPDGTVRAAAAQKRDVIVVHLRETEGGKSSTALLIDNATEQRGTTLLLPNDLAVSTDGSSTTTLGNAVGEGAAPTRDALDALLGAHIKGTWRLDTPYLENLVQLVGGITVDTDVTVPGEKKGEASVRRGRAQELDGFAAVAYSTYRAEGESHSKQLMRFGRVMQAVLEKASSDTDAATTTVRSLGQIPDPSLSESQLGASLAQLAGHAKKGSYSTKLLPVRPDGTLSERTSHDVVEKVLGGTVRNSDPNAAVRVSVKDAGGGSDAGSLAQAALVNGGYNVVSGGRGEATQASSRVLYADEAQAEQAKEVAKTLDLPQRAVRKGKGAANADVTVVLGQDYDG